MNKPSRLSIKIKEAIRSQQDRPGDEIADELHCSPVPKSTDELEKVNQRAGERRLYTKLIYRFIYIWCVAVAVLLLGCGFGKIRLSDMVLTTIIACTTLNVFGFFYLVTRYLFSKINRSDR